jgi:hypothetical protein
MLKSGKIVRIKKKHKSLVVIAHVGCIVKIVKKIEDDFFQVKVEDCRCSLKRPKGSPIAMVYRGKILVPQK